MDYLKPDDAVQWWTDKLAGMHEYDRYATRCGHEPRTSEYLKAYMALRKRRLVAKQQGTFQAVMHLDTD